MIMTMMIIMIMINNNNCDTGFKTWSIAEKHIWTESADTLLKRMVIRGKE